MKILAIAWKDTIVRFSDRQELLFFIVLPLVFTLLLSGVGGSQSEAAIPLLVVNQDGSSLAAELVDELSKSQTVKLEVVSLAEAEQEFAGHRAPAWLTIPAGFEASLLSGGEGRLDLHKAPNDSNADAAERAVEAAASRVNRALAVARNSVTEAERLQGFATRGEQQAFFSQSLAAAQEMFRDAPARVEVTRPPTAPDQSGAYNPAAQASAGQLITWVFIPLLGTSELMAFERNRRTLQRLLTTATGKATSLLGTITGRLGAAVVQMVLLVGFGVGVMKVNWGHSLPGLAVMLLTFGLASVAFGAMLGTFIKTEGQATNLSIMLGMSMALLGGCWMPIEIFPAVVRSAVVVLPTTWAMQGLTDLTTRGAGLVGILPEAGVLLAFSAVFLAIGAWRFRYE